MQASEPRPRHRAAWNLGYCGATAGGSFLHKRVVRSIVVIVGDVLVEQSPEVPLVEHDDLVEQLSPHTAYPTLRNVVLPRAPVRRSRWPQPSDATMETTRSPKLASRSNTKWRRLLS